MAKCPGCGIERKDISTQCPICGHKPAIVNAPVAPAAIPTSAPIPQQAPPIAKSRPGHPICQACGGEMKKKTVTSGQAAGCALGLITMFVGIVLCFLFPIGTIFGVLLIIVSLFMGGKRQKVWRCVSCKATINRA